MSYTELQEFLESRGYSGGYSNIDSQFGADSSSDSESDNSYGGGRDVAQQYAERLRQSSKFDDGNDRADGGEDSMSEYAALVRGAFEDEAVGIFATQQRKKEDNPGAPNDLDFDMEDDLDDLDGLENSNNASDDIITSAPASVDTTSSVDTTDVTDSIDTDVTNYIGSADLFDLTDEIDNLTLAGGSSIEDNINLPLLSSEDILSLSKLLPQTKFIDSLKVQASFE